MPASSLRDQTPFPRSVWRETGLKINSKMEFACEVPTDLEIQDRFQSSNRDVSKDILHQDEEGKVLLCPLWVPVAQY